MFYKLFQVLSIREKKGFCFYAFIKTNFFIKNTAIG